MAPPNSYDSAIDLTTSFSDITHELRKEVSIPTPESDMPKLSEKHRAFSTGDITKLVKPILRGAASMTDIRCASAERKSVTFNESVRVARTWHPTDYDRQAVSRKRRLEELLQIREELITYKFCEMQVHPESLHNIHVYKMPAV
eukprot:Colp12_sorted_trinity150504_noHs@6566